VLPFQLTGVAGVNNPNGTAWIFGNGSDIEILPYCGTLPVVADFNGDVHPCEKDTVTYTVSGQDVENYYWTFPAGWSVIGNPNNDTVTVKVGNTEGSVSIYATNICGFSGTLSFDATVSPLPTIFPINGVPVFCPGQFLNLQTAGINADIYHWSYPAGWQVIGDSTSADISLIASDQEGIVSVYASNLCGNSGVELIEMQQLTLPEPISFEVSGDTLYIEINEPLLYQWYLNGVPIPGATDSIYIVTQSGEYHVDITTNFGCTFTSTTQMIIFSSTSQAISTTNIKVNPSPADDFIQVTGAQPGESYTIINSLGAVVHQNHYDGQYISVEELPSGVYVIVVERKVGRFVKL